MSSVQQNLFSEIEDVAFILDSQANRLINMVVSAVRTLEQYGKFDKNIPEVKEQTLAKYAFDYALITVCSFLDEWEMQIGHLIKNNIEKDRFIRMKIIAKPAIAGIKQYTGVREYRNTVLAHNPRIGKVKDKNTFRGDYMASLKVPASTHDYVFLMNCVNFCRNIFNRMFPEYVSISENFIRNHTTINRSTGKSEKYINIELEIIQLEIQQLEYHDNLKHNNDYRSDPNNNNVV